MFRNILVHKRKVHFVNLDTIYIRIDKFFDGLIKGFSNMVKCESDPLVRTRRYKNGCGPYKSDKIESVRLSTHHNKVTLKLNVQKPLTTVPRREVYKRTVGTYKKPLYRQV